LVRKSINRDNFKLGGAISTKGYSDYPKYHQSGDRYFDRRNVDDVHYHLQHQKIIFSQVNKVSNWTKIFTVIASEAKQSQPLRLLDFTSFHMANATLRLRNDIV
jgi:hypothetical protein